MFCFFRHPLLYLLSRFLTWQNTLLYYFFLASWFFFKIQFSKLSLALPVWDWECLEDISIKGWVNEWINQSVTDVILEQPRLLRVCLTCITQDPVRKVIPVLISWLTLSWAVESQDQDMRCKYSGQVIRVSGSFFHRWNGFRERVLLSGTDYLRC